MYRRRVCFQTLSEFEVSHKAEWKVPKITKIPEGSENRPFSCIRTG
jgi:hypothetical protein